MMQNSGTGRGRRQGIGKAVAAVIVVVIIAVAAGVLLFMGGGVGTPSSSSTTGATSPTTTSTSSTGSKSVTTTSSNTNTNKLIITAVNVNVTGKAPSTMSVDVAGASSYVGFAGDQVPVQIALIYRQCSSAGTCPGHITAVKASTQGISVSKTDPAVPVSGNYNSDTGVTTFSVTITLQTPQQTYNGPVAIEVTTGA